MKSVIWKSRNVLYGWESFIKSKWIIYLSISLDKEIMQLSNASVRRQGHSLKGKPKYFRDFFGSRSFNRISAVLCFRSVKGRHIFFDVSYRGLRYQRKYRNQRFKRFYGSTILQLLFCDRFWILIVLLTFTDRRCLHNVIVILTVNSIKMKQ